MNLPLRLRLWPSDDGTSTRPPLQQGDGNTLTNSTGPATPVPRKAVVIDIEQEWDPPTKTVRSNKTRIGTETPLGHRFDVSPTLQDHMKMVQSMSSLNATIVMAVFLTTCLIAYGQWVCGATRAPVPSSPG